MKGLKLSTRKRVAVLLGLGLLNACSNDQINSPGLPVPPLRADLSGTVYGPVTLPTPPHNEAGVPLTPTGIEIPAGYLVRVTVTGKLHYSVNPDRLVCQPLVPPVTPPDGLYDVGPKGYPGGAAEIPIQNGGVLLFPLDPTAETVSGTGVASGTVYVSRWYSFDGSCGNNPQTGYQPDYLISGQQMLTVELVAPIDTIRVYLSHTWRNVAPTGVTTTQGPPLLNGQPWPDTLYLNVTVDSAGVHLPNRTVNLSLQAIDSAGRSVDSSYGHIHVGTGGAQKPAGSLAQTTVSTGSSGIARVRFKAGTISGPVVVRATSVDADSARDTLIVSIEGLQALVQSQSDTLIGQRGAHPINHYGIQAMVTRLNALADSFYATYNARLYFNDMSLSYGGKFDVDSSWSGRHSEHRVGRDADLREDSTMVGGLRMGQRRFIKALWRRLSGLDPLEESDPVHFHLRYRGQ